MPKVPQETLDAFGKAVFRARSLKGWTHDQLGAAMDGSSSKSFLSGIENGKRQISPPTVGRLINALNLDESWIDRFIDADTTPEAEANATRILDDAEEAGAVKRLAEAGVTETALIKLAQRITGQTSDLSQAWLELQNAMEIAVRVQAEGAGGSNHGDFVDEVLRRVAALSAEGSYAEAGEAIEAALAEEAAAHERRVERLLGSGIELAMLEGDAEKAASLLIRRADHAAGGQAGVAALRGIFIAHHEEGRDKGLAQPLEIAIALSRQSLARATDADERGTLQNDLATALQTLGERESSTERLEQAVTAFRAALKERTRDRVPLNWAGTQGNLANVEIAYFEKTGDPTHLTAARTHAEAALEVFTEAGATQYIGMAENILARITALETS